MEHISKFLPSELELKARMSTKCPVCGAKKEAGQHSQIVCWGDCWRSESGLKYTGMETDAWLKKYSGKPELL